MESEETPPGRTWQRMKHAVIAHCDMLLQGLSFLYVSATVKVLQRQGQTTIATNLLDVEGVFLHLLLQLGTPNKQQSS